jgi:hypothetical protein
MTGLVALLRRTGREIQSNLSAIGLCLVGLGVLTGAPASNAEPVQASERVRGFFCNDKTDSIDFLMNQAQGQNEEIAANTVNKAIAKFSCAYYLPADAIYTGEHTVMRDGLVFKLHSYVFLPEKVERWSGSVLGSLQQSPNAKHDA